MTPLSDSTATSSTPWYRHAAAPGWITLGAALVLVAVGAFAEEVAPAPCRVASTCGPEPFGMLSFGILSAVIVAGFLFPRAAPLLAACFLLAFAAGRITEVEYVWWVDVAAAGFSAVVVYLTWQRRETVPGLAATPAVMADIVAAKAGLMLVRPGWLLGCAVCSALAVAGMSGYLLGGEREMSDEWLLLAGIAGGLAVTLGWRSLDWSVKRRRFHARPQPSRPCIALPLRFEVMTVSAELQDPVLVLPSSVWEEARLEQLWADAGPDGCPALLYGQPVSGRWAAIDIGGELIVAREPARVEPRDDALSDAVTLLRHVADAVPATSVADMMRRTADRYAADVGEPDGSLPGTSL